MGDGANLLWQLKPRAQDDTGFHRGASIDFLSQFGGEDEVLFPPNTLLVVQPRKQGDPKSEVCTTSVRSTKASYREAAQELQAMQLARLQVDEFYH